MGATKDHVVTILDKKCAALIQDLPPGRTRAAMAELRALIQSVQVGKFAQDQPDENLQQGSNEFQEFTREVLEAASSAVDLKSLAEIVTGRIRLFLEMDAVGLRLKQGLDFPYYEARGFSESFLATERLLCAKDDQGRMMLDKAGHPWYECLCGAVLSGRIDPALPCFTTSGSFWTNSLSEDPYVAGFLPETYKPRNRCNLEGYESLALIPLKTGGALMGMLQFNDRRKNRFTADTIHMLETIAGHMAAPMAHQMAIETIKNGEQQLRQAQKMEAIGALAGGIAHDFNNILFPLIGFAEMLQNEISQDSKLRDFTDEILNAALRAKELVKQILTFSRETEKEIRPLQIQLILKEVIKLARSTLPASIHIHQRIDNQCGLVSVDPTHIHQIAMNLITNALHAMEDSGGTLTVALREITCSPHDRPSPLLEPGEYVLLSIADTGCGMSPAVMERIFDPYFTTKPKDKGTGLGLSVVHGIVKSYNGDITVRSEKGQGTVFNIYLPRDPQARKPDDPETPSEIPRGSERILLVDDEKPILKMEKQMLESLGYSVEAAAGGGEALAVFAADPSAFDLVITDMTMPDMTGADLARKLLDLRPDLPIILCTGFSEKISPETAFAMGIKGFLTKPAVRSELGILIRKIIDNCN